MSDSRGAPMSLNDTGPADVHHTVLDEDRVVSMSDTRLRALEDYIHATAEALGLDRWTIFLGSAPADEGTRAMVQAVEGRQAASIHVCDDWWDSTPDERRNDIVHELLHLTHRNQTDVIRVGLLRSGYLGDAAASFLWELFVTETEKMVDHLAGVLDKHVPNLPDPDEEPAP